MCRSVAAASASAARIELVNTLASSILKQSGSNFTDMCTICISCFLSKMKCVGHLVCAWRPIYDFVTRGHLRAQFIIILSPEGIWELIHNFATRWHLRAQFHNFLSQDGIWELQEIFWSNGSIIQMLQDKILKLKFMDKILNLNIKFKFFKYEFRIKY